MADTLTSVADDELQKAKYAQTQIGAALTQAQSDALQGQKDLDAANADLKTLNEQAAAIRRQIAQTSVAAEGDQLFADLEAKIVEIRAKEADVTELQEKVAEARSEVAAGNADAGLAAARVRTATQARADAIARIATDTDLKNKASTQPLSGLPAESDVAQDPARTAMEDARSRLQDDLPQELLDRAHSRREYARARLDALASQVGEARARTALVAELSGQSAASAKAALAFGEAESDLAGFVHAASARRDRALALLAGVAASTPMSNSEKQHLSDLRDAAVALEDQNTNENAFQLTAKVIDAQGKVDSKQDEIDKAKLDALAADPSADPENNQTVLDRKAELPPLEQKLTNAQSAVTNDMTQALAELDAAVPDATWELIDQYEEALVILGAIRDVNPGQLAQEVTAAETTYSQALRAELTTDDTIQSFDRRARESSSRADAFAPLRPARLLQATRGDD